MPESFEKSVKGATKIKLAPPKAKYIEHILVATHAGDAGVAEIFRVLQHRLRDSTWTIVFKALIVVHLMIREGEPNVTLKYLADSPSKLAISNFSDVELFTAAGQSTLLIMPVRKLTNGLLQFRLKAFKDTRIDWVREGVGRLKRQTVDKGLLRETEAVQHQINSLLRCDLLSSEAENEITVCAFRLLTMDLLVLYGVMNEGTINVLEHYFEMSKFDAQRALVIYKMFTKQTNLVVEFLGTARHHEHATRLEIPKLKHAPTSLTSSLEEYLNDPDFEVNRRQYLAHQEVKKGKKPTAKESSDAAKKPAANSGSTRNPFPDAKAASSATASSAPPKGPAPDLIDFFESIEQNQQPMAAQNQQSSNFQATQQTGYAPLQGFYLQNGQQAPPPQLEGGFGNQKLYSQPPQQPLQQNYTGAGFGGYSSQPFSAPQQDTFSTISQPTSASFPSQQQPFSTGQTSFALSEQPFMTAQPQSQQPFKTGQVQAQQAFSTSQPQSQQLFHTGQSPPQTTNPFRQSTLPQITRAPVPSFQSSPPMPQTLSPQSTNPFARSATTPVDGQPTGSPFTSPSPHVPSLPAAQQLTPQRTGTNPFARSTPQPSQPQFAAQPLVANSTGTTNPFRQSTFASQQTGQGSIGGLEQLPTVPVFPRPGQPGQQPQQQHPWS